jgi:hypothetical protein
MEYGLQSLPKVDFVEPAGIKWVTIDAESGLLPGPFTRSTAREPFIEGTEPKKQDDLHKELGICKASGRLATPYCPADQVEKKVFFVYPTMALDWARTANQPLPPATYCDQHGPNLRQSDASITAPVIYQSVKGNVQITGNARIPGFREYQLEYGQGLGPAQWFPIGGTHGNSVDNNVLENWDASQLNGLYTLRLTVRGSGDRQITVPVTVDNNKPKIDIISPADKSVFVLENDQTMSFLVEAKDDMKVDRVEFFLDNQKLGESRLAPFGASWTLIMTNTGRGVVPPVPDFQGELTGTENGQPYTWRRSGDTVTKELGAGENISRTVFTNNKDGLLYVSPSGWGVRKPSRGW